MAGRSRVTQLAAAVAAWLAVGPCIISASAGPAAAQIALVPSGASPTGAFRIDAFPNEVSPKKRRLPAEVRSDFNGDGYADLAIRISDDYSGETGMVQVVFGWPRAW